MGRTARRLFISAWIGSLLALTAIAGAAAPAARDEAASPAALPASAAAFAERTAGGHSPALKADGSLRTAIELIVLALTCGIVVAFYSASGGGRGSRRVQMRIRRR